MDKTRGGLVIMTPIIKVINTYYMPGPANLLILTVNILGSCYFLFLFFKFSFCG